MAGMIRMFRPRLPAPEREAQFRADRQWRFDFAWPAFKVALEVEGGTWLPATTGEGWGQARGGGRHAQPAAFEKDCVKYGEAAVDGWLVLRVTNHMVHDGRAVDLLYRTLLAVQQRRETVDTAVGFQ